MNTNLAICQIIGGRGPNVLILIGHLIGMWVQLSVGSDDTIAVKAVIRRVILIEVAAIDILVLRLRTIKIIVLCVVGQTLVVSQRASGNKIRLSMQGLINKVPIESTLRSEERRVGKAC